MKKHLLLLLVLFLFTGFYSGDQNEKNPEITAAEIQDHINFLADDKLEGRMTGTEGESIAAEYISKDFESSGIKPLFDDSYFQSFSFVADLELTDNNYFTIVSEDFDLQPELNKEYITTPFSDNVEISGNIVFAGYGISAPDLNYDDYKNIDVTDKIVVVMRYNPEPENPHSEFAKYSEYRYKATTAMEKGAKGIIFVKGFIPEDDADKLMALRYDGAGEVGGLAAVDVKRDVIVKLFENEGLDFQTVQEEINENKNPNSFQFKDANATIQTDINQILKEGRNVAGYLEGNDPKLKDEYIIIGAHYDHLGWGTRGSLYRGSDKKIHNGADDNASGTAGVMEIAEKFAANKDQLKRSMIFVSFSGEELGLLGSTHFVNNLPVPVEDVSAMINMDMIGRLNENSLIVYGTGTSSIWKDLLNEYNTYDFNLTFNDEGYGPSDHSSFYAKNIPVLFFFTGTHSQYHRPEDDADLINSTGEEKIVNYVYTIVDDIDENETEIDYVNVPRKQSEGRMTFRVYVGTIPDYSGQAEGLKINGVSEGSPAQKSGLQGGDVIIKFGDKKITNIYDYTYALGDYSPGDVVDVVVIRDGEERTFKVELGAR